MIDVWTFVIFALVFLPVFVLFVRAYGRWIIQNARRRERELCAAIVESEFGDRPIAARLRNYTGH